MNKKSGLIALILVLLAFSPIVSSQESKPTKEYAQQLFIKALNSLDPKNPEDKQRLEKLEQLYNDFPDVLKSPGVDSSLSSAKQKFESQRAEESKPIFKKPLFYGVSVPVLIALIAIVVSMVKRKVKEKVLSAVEITREAEEAISEAEEEKNEIEVIKSLEERKEKLFRFLELIAHPHKEDSTKKEAHFSHVKEEAYRLTGLKLDKAWIAYQQRGSEALGYVRSFFEKHTNHPLYHELVQFFTYALKNKKESENKRVRDVFFEFLDEVEFDKKKAQVSAVAEQLNSANDELMRRLKKLFFLHLGKEPGLLGKIVSNLEISEEDLKKVLESSANSNHWRAIRRELNSLLKTEETELAKAKQLINAAKFLAERIRRWEALVNNEEKKLNQIIERMKK